MRGSELVAVALASASMVNGLPSMANSNDGDMLEKRQTAASGFPMLDGEQLEELWRLYGVYSESKNIHDFTQAVSKAAPGTVLPTLAKKLGGGATASRVRGALNSLPAQPQNIVIAYLMGIGECLIQGKDFSAAAECGKNKVRTLKPNDTVDVPMTCNNRLGQLELFGTGWPAPCHDPTAITHPQGSAAHRAFKWGLCRFSTWFYPDNLRQMEERNGGTCDDRFPTDQQIKNNLCEKYFGGSPCGASFPLETEDDFKKAAEHQLKVKAYLAGFPPQVKFEGMLDVQAKGPDFLNLTSEISLAGETCLGGKCGEICQLGGCFPSREVCEPACIPDETEHKCNCGWDQWRMDCNSCHVDKCGTCVQEAIYEKDGKFFAGFHDPKELHTECRDNGECYFVPNRPVAPINA